MLNDFFSKPIEITIGEKSLKFSSLADFEFSLAGRTSVPEKKIATMVKFSIDELKKEARAIKNMEKRFISILSKSIEDPNGINRTLREIESHIFSQDHDWRSIIGALHNGGDELNEFRRVALAKYMQYLSSRQEIIRYLYYEKKKYGKSVASANSMGVDAKSKGVLILDDAALSNTATGQYQNDEMQKMPKGENVTIRMKADKKIILWLSKNSCRITANESGCKFIDEAERNHDLKVGKNVIGRDSNDILMNPNLRDISRIHLIIEADDTNTLYLTDLSAHGTYLPAKYLKSHTF